MVREILVTNALPYANGPIHLGHLVGYIQADIWVRYMRMQGHQCSFVCGADAHGTPIMIKAQQLGISPEELIKQLHHEHATDFADFHVDFDLFHTTHSDENRTMAETIYERLLANGDIETRIIHQAFDPEHNMFLPDRYVKGECPRCNALDQYGDNCEVCGATYSPTELINPYSTLSGATPIEKATEHYFVNLSKYTTVLKEWTNAGHLQSAVAHKLNEWFEAGLKSWDITRDAPYFGFQIPGKPGKFFYVWMDAPIGYMASFKHLCERRPDLDFGHYWDKNSPTELHQFIGKDIIYFHSLFWPAMLTGASFRTPTGVYAHGYLTINGEKMSKSRGTFIRARTYLEHLQPEYLRYYFATKLNNSVEDINLNLEDFMQRVNSDLIGKVVNIASRCAGFINKFFDNTLAKTNNETALYQDFVIAGEEIGKLYEQRDFNQAMRKIMELADRANQYIDEKKPWKLIKEPGNKQLTHEVCSVGLNLFRVIMTYLKPTLPKLAEAVEQFLKIAPMSWDNRSLPLENHTIEKFQPLMQRIEEKQLINLQTAAAEESPVIEEKAKTRLDEDPLRPEISYDDFAKVDLRIAKILEAEAVKDADKLLKLKVDLDGKTCQIFAGIKSAYQPEDLVGRHTVVVANLAPRKMRFGLSEAMVILASTPEGGKDLWLLSPDEGAKAGMRVK